MTLTKIKLQGLLCFMAESDHLLGSGRYLSHKPQLQSTAASTDHCWRKDTQLDGSSICLEMVISPPRILSLLYIAGQCNKNCPCKVPAASCHFLIAFTIVCTVPFRNLACLIFVPQSSLFDMLYCSHSILKLCRLLALPSSSKNDVVTNWGRLCQIVNPILFQALFVVL